MTSKRNLLKSAALVGAITATGAVATTTAHADTTPASQPAAQSATSSTTAQDQLNNLKQTQTKEENDLTAQNAAQYQKDQAAVEPQIKSAQSQLANQQASQSAQDQQAIASAQAQYQAEADNAAKQENQTYANTVNTENAQYAGATAGQQAINQQAEDKLAQENQKALADAAENVRTPEQKIQDRQNAKIAYDNQVATTQANESTDVKAAQKAHQATVDDLNNQIQQATTNASQSHDAAVKTATDAVKTAQAQVDTDTKANNDAQSTMNSAKSALDQAKTNLDNAEKANQNAENADFVPKVTITGDPYGNGFDFTMSDDDYDKATNDQRTFTFSKNGRIPEQTMQEIDIWTVNILNQLRQQVGSVPLHVSSESIAAADDAMQQYNQTGKSSFSHNYDIYNNVDHKYNLPNFKSSIMGDDEIGPNYNSNKVQTGKIGVFKESILRMLHGFINDSGNLMQGYGHRNHLLGLADNKYGYDWSMENQGTPYFAIGQSYDGNSTHFFVSTNGYKQHDLPLNGSTTSTQDISTLQTAVSQAQTAYNTAKSKADQTAQTLTNDQAALKTANDNLAKTQAGTVEAPEVANLKTQLDQENKNYQAKLNQIKTNYQDQLDQLKKDYDAKINQIDMMPESNTALKTKLDQKLADLKSEDQAKLDKLTQDHDTKLAQLKKDHEAKLNAIQAEITKKLDTFKKQLADQHTKDNQGIVDQITKLQLQLTSEKENLDHKLTNLKHQHEIAYATLAAKLTPKQSESDAVKGNSDHYTTSNGQTVDLKPGSSSSSDNGSTTISSVKFIPHENNGETKSNAVTTTLTATPTANATTPESTISTSAPTTTITYPTREEYKQSQLPQTGNSNSMAVVALGVLSSMFGLGLVAKKKNI